MSDPQARSGPQPGPGPRMAVPALPHYCPECGADFGVPQGADPRARWDSLLATVTAHLAETDAHGTGWVPD